MKNNKKISFKYITLLICMYSFNLINMILFINVIYQDWKINETGLRQVDDTTLKLAYLLCVITVIYIFAELNYTREIKDESKL